MDAAGLHVYEVTIKALLAHLSIIIFIILLYPHLLRIKTHLNIINYWKFRLLFGSTIPLSHVQWNLNSTLVWTTTFPSFTVQHKTQVY